MLVSLTHSNPVPAKKERIFMEIVGALLRGGLMTLCLSTPGTAQYIILVVADFVVIFS